MQKIFAIAMNQTARKSECTTASGERVFYDLRPVQLLNAWCMKNGSTFQGRIDAFKALTGARQKPAVLISERSQQIYFPTLSDQNEACIWLSFNHIFQIHSAGPASTQIVFANGYRKTVDFNYRILRRQMDRCRLFLQRLNQTEAIVSVQLEDLNAIIRTAGEL